MEKHSGRITFLGTSISTATSPYRGSFELSCRSPVTPRRTNWQYGEGGKSADNVRANARYPQPSHFASVAFDRPLESPYKDGNERSNHSPTILENGQSSIPEATGQLGTFSAINIILGKTIGVGIYSIPSSIFVSVGSVGATLLMWVLGAMISFCGLAVYLDLGTAIPRSGGERVYLERIFRQPYMLATCMFMSYVVLLGFSAPNCIVLGEYVLYALEIEVNSWNVRILAISTITFLCLVHARYPTLGLRIINILGVLKMLILVTVILSGFAFAFLGIINPTLYRRRLGSTHNEFLQPPTVASINFSNLFAGSSTQPYDYATSLLKVLYCFRGYSTANTISSSLSNPIPTLKFAAPVALLIVSLCYILANIAFFLVISTDDFAASGIVIAGVFFKAIFGSVIGERVLPVLVIISAFGNIAATSYAQARVNQELGHDGLLPFHSLFSHSPTASQGLFIHWLVSILVILLPAGKIYYFLVNIGGYPVSVISVAISLGLLYLQSCPEEKWESPFRAKKRYVWVFAGANMVLLVLPWVRPSGEQEGMVYFAYPATALAVLGAGALYWIGWRRWGADKGKRMEIGSRLRERRGVEKGVGGVERERLLLEEEEETL